MLITEIRIFLTQLAIKLPSKFPSHLNFASALGGKQNKKRQ